MIVILRMPERQYNVSVHLIRRTSVDVVNPIRQVCEYYQYLHKVLQSVPMNDHVM